MNPQALLLLGLVAGGGYMFYKHRERIEAAAKKALPTGLRIPRPDYVVTIPRAKEDLDTIDEFLCECIAAMKLDLPGLETEEQIIRDLQFCLASRLYPDFQWPPIIGDHETIHQLWLLIEFRVRSLANREELATFCTVKPQPSPIDIPPPQPQPGS